MSLVVDSSVLVAALVDTGPAGVWAVRTLAEDSLHAPELARVEAANVLRRLERSRHISAAEAQAAFDDLMRLDIEMFPFEPFAWRVWELRHAVTSYDGWFVSVAEALACPLATLDESLAKASGPACRFLTPETAAHG